MVDHLVVSQKLEQEKNSMGANGRPLTCKACGSYRHLIAHCQDSLENIAREKKESRKSNIFSDDELEVLFNSHNQENSVFISGRSCGYAVLDSAYSSTVCGEK